MAEIEPELKEKPQRIRELDEKYVSIIPHEYGRKCVALETERIRRLYEKALDAAHPYDKNRPRGEFYVEEFNRQRGEYSMYIQKRCCSGHITHDEYIALNMYCGALGENIWSRTWTETHRFQAWVDDVKF